MGRFMKIAMTMGHMKSVLRGLKSQGVNIHRTPQQMQTALADQYQSRVSEIPLLGKYLGKLDKKIGVSENAGKGVSNVISMRGPHAMHDKTILSKNKHMYLPRNVYLPGEATKTSPRATALHEAGHIEHMLDDPEGAYRALTHTKSGPQYRAELINKMEGIANNNAILKMRENGVPAEMIERYKQSLTPAFGTYRKSLDNVYKALPEGMTGFGMLKQIISNKIKKKKLLEGLNLGENPIPSRAEEFRIPWSPDVGGDAPPYEDHVHPGFAALRKMFDK